jgi:diazepam-binding inhibitor (GABA receptor modulating acyl-CoA-binding protein)
LLQGKAKWDAWNGKKGMSQEEAKQKYIEYTKQMLEKHGARPE